MIRKVLSGLVLVGAVLVSLSQAQAATEVMRFPANNTFATAVANDPVTNITTGIFVSRHKTDKGGPVNTLFYSTTLTDGTNCSGSVDLDPNDFHVDGHAASVDINLNDYEITSQSGPIPGDGSIHVYWAKTGVTRTNGGGSAFNSGGFHVVFTGTNNTAECDVEVSAFGADLNGVTGDVRTLQSAVIVILKD